MDVLHVAQFKANDQFGTAIKDLLTEALKEVRTTNQNIVGLEDTVGALLATDAPVEKIRKAILMAGPLMNSIAAQSIALLRRR